MEYSIIDLRDHPQWAPKAARWFHSKWKVPLAASEESMAQCLAGKGPVPQWYLAVDGDAFVGGMGVIENDFHDRKDLAPNVCAVYTEREYRNQGIAGARLSHVCTDMAAMGIDTLYLATEHTSFYERYGWEYFCPVRGDGEDYLSRMYRHQMK